MNSITHFELPSTEESKKFYQETFGWKTQDLPMSDHQFYTMVSTSEVDDKNMPLTPGAVNGGMVSIKDNGGLNPVLVIDVPNIEEVLKKVEAAGLEIVVPLVKVSEMGLYARFKDHAGVIMGIWQSIKQ